MKISSRWYGTFSAYLLATLVFLADQVSKILVEVFISLPGTSYSVIPVFDLFRITFVHNPGAAWGILPGYKVLFVAVALAVTVVCVTMIERHPFEPIRYSWALVLGGGLGNMIDRLFTEMGVVDFLDAGIYGARWPTFNLADASLCVGMIWLAYGMLWVDFQSKEAGEESDDEHE